jgi:aminomethyltransferase
VIINCANREQDVQWLQQHPRGEVEIRDISQGRDIIAVQGPAAGRALESALKMSVGALGRFELAPLRLGKRAWVARTGYTGSDGFELFLEDAQARQVWQQLIEQGSAWGLHAIGLGARDTLRLEAGLRLYGTDMDITTSPYEADLGWTVAINKSSFLGKEVLVTEKANGVARKLVGFQLGQGPLPRQGCPLLVEDRPVGQVTSGTFSPMLNACIGMGYVETAIAKPGTVLSVVIRNKPYPATIVKMPFWQSMERRSPATGGGRTPHAAATATR